MSGIGGDLFIVLGVFMVSLSLINLGFRAGVKKGIREAIIDDARHRDHAVEQLGHAVLDMAGAGAEEIRLIHDDSCDAWVATGLSRHPMGEGGND